MTTHERIRQYLYARRDEIADTLLRLARIPSVRGNAVPGAPYGPACREVLEETAKIYAEHGFADSDLSDDGYLLTHIGTGERTIGLFAHGDVVPPGEGWTYTEPFSPIVRDGILVGRGVGDNKSGITASLFAACAIRDLGLPLSSRLLCFTGANEESGMGDIAAYTRTHAAHLPDASLVPDAAFPVYRGEKGILRFWAKSAAKLTCIRDFSGGEAFNIVLGKAAVTLAYTADMAAALAGICMGNPRLTLTRQGGTLVLAAEGISKHAALPEGSLNAAMLLSEALMTTGLLPEPDQAAVAFLQKLLSNSYGEQVGIAAADPDFGRTSMVNGMIALEDGHLKAAFDVRFVQTDSTEMIEKIHAYLASAGWEMEIVRNSPGFKIPLGDPILEKLLAAYSRLTGQENPQPLLNAGGTYARCLPKAYAIGTCFWRPIPFPLASGHGSCHQPDEVLPLDGHIDAIAVATEMLLEMDRCLHG